MVHTGDCVAVIFVDAIFKGAGGVFAERNYADDGSVIFEEKSHLWVLTDTFILGAASYRPVLWG